MLPVRLAARALDKVWGSPLTEPWFHNPEGRKIGEIWFPASAAVPLLVKLLFTSEGLSVQVHPDDAYAAVHENGSKGKTEMWHVLRAEPGARIGIGLKEPASRERVREAALSGEILDLMNWEEARAGDTFLAPAGTIHAIGGGLAICEIQQVSDVTYRLYDFGRPRELHLEKGFEVAELGPRQARVAPVELGGGRELLAECRYFRTERVSVKGSAALPDSSGGFLAIAVAGEGSIAGERFGPGQAWEIAANSGPVAVESEDAVFVLTGCR